MESIQSGRHRFNRPRNYRSIVLGGLLLPGSAIPAQAQFFWYEAQEREVSASNTGSPTVTNSAPDFGPWNSSVSQGTANASQNSTLEATSITYSAFARGLAPPTFPSNPNDRNTATGSSGLDVHFELLQSFNYSLSGTRSFVSSGRGSANAGVQVRDGLGSLVFNLPSGAGSFNLSGVLPQGHYRLIANTSATGVNGLDAGIGNGMADLNFTFTLTPEPATMALLAGGLAIFARRRRRKA